MTFRVGQKVVCVDDDFYSHDLAEPLHLPVKGGIYTLRDPFSADGWTWWRVAELTNGATFCLKYGTMEPAFAPHHFRPIVSTETDISIFTRMLTDQKVDA